MQAQINQHAASRWPLVRLGDVCEIIGGGTPSKEKPEFYNGDIRWATVRDMRNDVIEDTENKITAAAVKASATHIIPAGNVIIATRVGLGKTCILAGDTAINQDLRGIVPAKTHTVVPKYLFYWFKSIAHKIIAEGTGATVQGVKVGFVQSLLLPLPPLAEQHRIVARLDAAFAAIAEATAAAEANLRNARALFDSYLDQVFSQRGPGWVERRLGDVVHRLTNGYVGPTRDIYVRTGIPYLLARHVKNNKLLFDKLTYVTQQFNQKNSKSILKEGDMLLVQSGHIGHTAVVPNHHAGHNCHAMIVITPHEEVFTGKYLSLYFSSPKMKQLILSKKSGSTIPHLTCGEIRELIIPFPEISVQNEMCSRVERFEINTFQLEQTAIAKLTALAELKQSLLVEVFGEG